MPCTGSGNSSTTPVPPFPGAGGMKAHRNGRSPYKALTSRKPGSSVKVRCCRGAPCTSNSRRDDTSNPLSEKRYSVDWRTRVEGSRSCEPFLGTIRSPSDDAAPISILHRRVPSPPGPSSATTPCSATGATSSGRSSTRELVGEGGASQRKPTTSSASRSPRSDQVNRKRPERSTSTASRPSAPSPILAACPSSSQTAWLIAKPHGVKGSITGPSAEWTTSIQASPPTSASASSRAV